MAKLLVEYSKVNIFFINYVDGGGSIKLMPGVNEVDSDKWALVANHPLLPARFKSGDLKWIPGNGPDDVKGKPDKVAENPISKMTQVDAIEIIKKTVDIEVLKRWAEIEKRAQVVKAIKEQIKKIGPVKPNKEEKSKVETDQDQEDDDDQE